MDAASPAVSRYPKRERTPSTASVASIQKVREQIKKTEKNEPIEQIPPAPLFDFLEEDNDEDKLPDCSIIALTELAYAVFGKGQVDRYLEGTPKKHISKKLRHIWELAGIEEQCNAVIGRAVDKETKCWICGFEVDESIPGLKASCEHVLPIAQARFFLDLYNPEYNKDGGITPEKRQLLTLEYAWSHLFCNLMKGQSSYLEPSKDDAGNLVWKPNKKNIIKTIDNILNYSTSDKERFYQKSYDKIIGRIKVENTKWKQTRIDEIVARKVIPILNYLQGSHMEKGRSGLVMLAGVAECLSPDNIRRQFNAFLGAYEMDLKIKDDEAANALVELSKASEEVLSPPPSKRKTARVSPSPKGGKTRRNIRTKK